MWEARAGLFEHKVVRIFKPGVMAGLNAKRWDGSSLDKTQQPWSVQQYICITYATLVSMHACECAYAYISV